MSNAIEVSGLYKKYKDFSLENVSFTLPNGCIMGFIGANGAGKSTTIKSILHLINTGDASIKFWGMDLNKHEQEIKDRIGVVLDGDSFYDDLTMAQMKTIIAPAYSNWSESDFSAYMERFYLNPHQKISMMSKGMKAKFAIALALSHNADLLIMDEPTSGLDPVVRREVMGIITEFMRDEGKSVLFSTHIVSDLERIADILLLIDNGRIVFQEDKDALMDIHKLIKGNTDELTADNRKLFLTLTETAYGFEGITANVEQIKKQLPSAVIERASVEDIMLAYIGGKKE